MSIEVRQLSTAQMPTVWLNTSLQAMSQVAGNVPSDRKPLASYPACLQFCMKAHWLLVLVKLLQLLILLFRDIEVWR